MKLTNYFIPTRKEIPKEAEIASHKMMLRAGLIRQHVAGAYAILPMGWRVLKNIMEVIRQEMDAIGCHEFLLPALSPGELWRKSGRWDTFGDDMFKFRDRKGRDMCLAPTHEEVFTEIAAYELHSYRDLPQMWYQIQTKFRDEVRPRSGLIRVRQFLMKDAYSFDVTPEGLDESYRLQREAYLKIFARCGLDVSVVRASSGAMGGGDCEEFMLLSDAGDDQIVHCPACGYAANQEIARSTVPVVSGAGAERKKVHTPEKRTIADVSDFLGVETAMLVKSLVYATGDGFAFVLVRGDHQVDEDKLENALGPCRPAEPEEVKEVTGADVGFVSPVGIGKVKVIADTVLDGAVGMVAGANENQYHFTGVSLSRDMAVDEYLPLRTIKAGEACIECGKPLDVARTIEVGHIFKLGTRYSETLGANVLDKNGESRPIVMGSYGIGVERIMACAIETHFDGSEMKWPRQIAPFDVQILPLNVTSEPLMDVALKLYDDLKAAGIETLFDDRNERAGSKFKDAALFGIPVVVVVGDRNLSEGVVEFRVRDKNANETVPVGDILARVLSEVPS